MVLFIVLCVILCVLRSVVAETVGQHHHKLYNLSDSAQKPWMVLKEVDGLKNEDIVVLVSSSMVKKGYYLRGR